MNPPGSLTVASGRPKLGTTMVLGVDNPFFTQAPGSLPYVVVSSGPDPGFPCGTAVPGWGMSFFPPFNGELLIDLAAPGVFTVASLTTWSAPGVPAPVNLKIPNKASLLCTDVYVQGVLIDLTPGALHQIGLADAVQLTLGNL